MKEINFAEEIRAAIPTLVVERGEDWHTKIVWEKLDISSGEDCVLGQLYGHYHKAPASLRVDHRDAFVTLHSGGMTLVSVSPPCRCPELGQAWLDYAREQGWYK